MTCQNINSDIQEHFDKKKFRITSMYQIYKLHQVVIINDS